jgi:hypothetical protein
VEVDAAREALLERERELAALDALLTRAGAPPPGGGLVVVEGPARIGKTRLLAAARAAARGLAVFGAHGSDHRVTPVANPAAARPKSPC